MLSTDDHSRDSAGLRYVYPVISRRAGGVSIGVNLNPNNACNWACVYCQVENLGRGGPPPLDLPRLRSELLGFLEQALHGPFMVQQVPSAARRLVDVAFSGNGEPTSAPEFAEAVDVVGDALSAFGLRGALPVRLISNGSLMHRPNVQAGLRQLAGLAGEVWFKVDRGLPAEVAEINGVPGVPEKVAKNLGICCSLVPTRVQTCWFALDGDAPSAASLEAYCDLLRPFAAQVQGIHLYGLARPSQQPAASRLRALAVEALQATGKLIEEKTGIRVMISP